jgi:hypothetical protein
VASDSTIDWLLEGDPAIRWQVMRDLLDEPVEAWQSERRRTVEIGWVAELLGRQGKDGEWPKGRWTDSTWTLLLLVALGLPEAFPGARAPIERLIGRFMPPGRRVDGEFLLSRVDLCHLGFWLGLGSHLMPGDPRLPPLGEAVLRAQLADGGWNCQTRNYPTRTHGSFNTTFNVLENLRRALAGGEVDAEAFATAEARALEFILEHRLFRSHTSGAIADPRFLQFTYPWHWHYTALRGLDYLRWLRHGRKPNGHWPLQSRIPGTLLVEMEKPGGESRWNTLRALRVLRARDNRNAPSGRADGA